MLGARKELSWGETTQEKDPRPQHCQNKGPIYSARHRLPPLAVMVVLGAELSRGQALIATIIATILLEAQRLLSLLTFRDALNFKQMLMALIWEGEGGSHVPDMKTRCLPYSKDEKSWEKQEPSPRLPAVPSPACRENWGGFGAVPRPGAGSQPPLAATPGIRRLLQRGCFSFPFPQE